MTFVSNWTGHRMWKMPVRHPVEDLDVNSWKKLYFTNIERLQSGQTALYVVPDDYIYPTKFVKVGELHNGLVTLWRNNTGKSRQTLIVRDLSVQLPPTLTKVLMVETPRLTANQVEFDIVNLAGSVIGTFSFGKHVFVNTQRLRHAILGDIGDVDENTGAYVKVELVKVDSPVMFQTKQTLFPPPMIKFAVTHRLNGKQHIVLSQSIVDRFWASL